MNELVTFLDDGGSLVTAWSAAPSDQLLACVVSRRSLQEHGLKRRYPNDGLALDVLDDLAGAVRTFAARRNRFDFAMVFYDDFEQDRALIDHLCRIRVRAPNLPVILISETFRGHDLGQERLCIADVSLRGPITEDLLRIALSAAVVNNRAWRKRLRSLRLAKARL